MKLNKKNDITAFMSNTQLQKALFIKNKKQLTHSETTGLADQGAERNSINTTVKYKLNTPIANRTYKEHIKLSFFV